MDASLRKKLLKKGIEGSVIATLEEQKLTECTVLDEVEPSVLMLCGIKAGDALKIKRVIKEHLSTENIGESENEASMNIEMIGVEHSDNEVTELDKNGEKQTDREECPAINSDSPASPFVECDEKTKRMFFRDFKLLDKFFPNVTQALQDKCFTGPQRSEFIRDICTNISSHEIYFLNKEQRSQVALAIVTKYPHLKDSIGSGLGSWTEAIKNRFKHVRKYENKKHRSCKQPTTWDQNKPNQPLIKRPRRLDFWNEIPNSGRTTDAIQKEHLSELQKEMQKSASIQDKDKIKTLMGLTYELRRKEILTITIPVREIVEKYPGLATISGIRREFNRILEDSNATKEMKEKIASYQKAIVKYCKKFRPKIPYVKNALQALQKAISQDPEKIKAYENTFSLMVLPKLLETKPAKEEDLIQMLCEDDDLDCEISKVTFPKLIGIGEDMLQLDQLILVVEGEKLVDGSTYPLDSVFFAMHACYYVFSIQYPKKHKGLFNFVDSVLLGLNSSSAGNRIALQKFVQAINSLI